MGLRNKKKKEIRDAIKTSGRSFSDTLAFFQPLQLFFSISTARLPPPVYTNIHNQSCILAPQLPPPPPTYLLPTTAARDIRHNFLSLFSHSLAHRCSLPTVCTESTPTYTHTQPPWLSQIVHLIDSCKLSYAYCLLLRDSPPPVVIARHWPTRSPRNS